MTEIAPAPMVGRTQPPAPARVGRIAERLTRLRRAAARCTAPSALAALVETIAELRKILPGLDDDGPLFDDCVDAIMFAQKRAGHLLLAGAWWESYIGKRLANRCTKLAQMTDGEYAREREIELGAARRQRQVAIAVQQRRQVDMAPRRQRQADIAAQRRRRAAIAAQRRRG